MAVMETLVQGVVRNIPLLAKYSSEVVKLSIITSPLNSSCFDGVPTVTQTIFGSSDMLALGWFWGGSSSPEMQPLAQWLAEAVLQRQPSSWRLS